MQKTHDSVGNYYVTPLWVPDGMKAGCKACGCRFSLFKRRHHCRLCGSIFCGECSSEWMVGCFNARFTIRI